ncbi:CHAT domain-containing protein, partial [Frankia sp. Ag45/Mut15]
RAGYLSNLGAALQARFARTGQLTNLDEAISVGRAAVDVTPPDHPDRAGYLSNLGAALQARFARTGQLTNLELAIEAHRTGVGVMGASPRTRAVAARGWGRAAAGGGRWEEAVAGFTAAAELLTQVAPRSLALGDQEYLLAEFGGLGADAAACCVQAGMPERAVELFEQTRGVLLGQALDTRADLTALVEQHPDLAASFIQLRDILDWRDGPALPDLSSEDMAEATEQRITGVAFEELIASIRQLVGFESFLQPPPLNQLLAAASEGPVVAVAVSQFGSYALLVTSNGVEAVQLPELTQEAVAYQVFTLFAALEAPSVVAQERLTECLVWLWDVVASLVLDRLGIVGPPFDGNPWPRVWWCASGLLSFLPLHAAGHHGARFDEAPATVIDRVISSYTPTLRALVHARYAGARSSIDLSSGRLVTVAMPQTPGAGNLPGTEIEVANLQTLFPGRIDVLAGKQATWQAVIDRLPAARWAHFACAAVNDLYDPLKSSLLLVDKPLTVLDLVRMRLRDAELAFLSTSNTALPGARLADEAIHLASAFQLAGYRHVIATLWPISDQYAVEVADEIYTTLATTGDVAAAVHGAARMLRGMWAANPSAWASHIHVGA